MVNRNSRTTALLLLLALAPFGWGEEPPARMDAWRTPLRGANYETFNPHAARDFKAARAYGMRVLRIFTPGLPRDWPADKDFFASPEFDKELAKIDRVLEFAAAADLKIILVAGCVPYRQYEWYTHGRGDRRLWRKFWRHDEVASFWKKLAIRFRQAPAIVAYEPLNEPHPEVLEDREAWTDTDLRRFAKRVRGTPADVNEFYARVVRAVRSVDKTTPLILDAGFWASPRALFGLRPIEGDARILYSVHWYEPAAYTIWRKNKGRLSYPGCAVHDAGAEAPTKWTAKLHESRLGKPVADWCKKHGIPANRILLGEFSADRRAPGANAWNRDVVAVAERRGWHWTYYHFREQAWGAKDFELGTDEKNKTRSRTPLLETFLAPMNKPATSKPG